MRKNISEYDLNSFLEKSYLLDNLVDTRIWFAHLKLNILQENKFPDAGQIVDYFLSEINLPKIDFFILLIDRKHIETWTGSKDYVNFQELIEIKFDDSIKDKNNLFIKKRGCIWKSIISRDALLKIISQNQETPLESIAKNRHASIISTDKPFRLEILNITKPWGYESWYTGVEKRGVVKIVDNYGKTELPYSLKIFKKQLLANFPEELILLKKLNPSSKPTIGDLYYEMHEKKWEVYVVTEIDKTAWPSGTGIVKAGLNSEKIRKYKKKYKRNWKKFLVQDFMKAIAKYEAVRRKIDFSNKNIAKELLENEPILRKEAASFVGDYYVREGDIVSFPVFQIHSLQHGIKVIEFQTPHYERLIVMFSQKVITQDHWDSERALKIMIPEVYNPPKPKQLLKSEGFSLERFVDFPQFTADRLILQPKISWNDQLRNQYHILIAISGKGKIITEGGLSIHFNREEALFLPISMGSYVLKNTGKSPLTYLKAMPK